MTGTASALRLVGHGAATLPAALNLQPTASGTWNDTGLQVVLPAAGTYDLDAVVRAALSGTSPVNTYITARLFDVTAGVVVPESEVIVHQIALSASAGVVNSSTNTTSSIAVQYAVPGPRTIRLQGRRVNATGASITAEIQTNADGRTTLRYTRVA